MCKTVVLPEEVDEKDVDGAPLADVEAMPEWKIKEEENLGCGVCCPLDLSLDGVVGSKRYDYKYLCMPSMPWSKGGAEPPLFLGKDDRLPLLVAALMGLQHSLAMVAGIATSGGALIAGDACFAWQKDSAMCDAREYMISAAWITSGLLTIVQVFRAKIRGTQYYLGTGLISVMGTSFTFLPIVREMVLREISDAKNDGNCPGGDCQGAGKRGYGKFLGTCMVAAWFEVGIALLPPRIQRKLFPNIVTGTAVMLIGASLISSGVKYIGGGVFCGENDLSRSAAFGGPQLCEENGDVVLAFGAPEYVGLGFSVIFMSTFLQFFGSPFLKSTFLFWGLMFGCLCAGLSSYTAKEGDVTLDYYNDSGKTRYRTMPAVEGKKYSYFNNYRIKNAPTFVFLWDTTFPIGFSAEYFLPILIGFFVTSAETVGDVAMSCKASRIPAEGPDFDARIQGGLLADGLNSFIAVLCTSPPNTTFSQNNGVILMTQCASRAAGFACAAWLVGFGLFGKLGAAFSSIPICVVGGLVLQCFAMVMVSGMTIACKNITRRNSFILMIALALGFGVALEPNIFEGGSGYSYFSKNLQHNIGFWPRSKTCDKFPTVTTTGITSQASCAIDGYSWQSADAAFPTTCAEVGGDYTAATLFSTTVEVTTCVGKNGLCCLKYNERMDSFRTAAIIILKTPYCIGFLVALFLHLLLPEDKKDEEDSKFDED
mmetsp:Transcript_34403/g.118591  ORF Transcript_34403/g.118591 Transcript_34403/m.118591 type:complete len:709 (+) Transcript_34403:71-2197(+)